MNSTPEQTPTALICLDLDGTSVEHDGLHAWFSDAVAEALNDAAGCGAVWCSNSGRPAENQYGLIQACRTLDAMPIAILSGERYIHDLHPTGYALVARQPNNDLAAAKARDLTTKAKEVLAPSLDRLQDGREVAEFHPGDEFIAWLLTEQADWTGFVAEVRRALRPLPEAQVLRNGRWVIVVHADFGKGKILTETARTLGVPPSRILAVGDQPNDLDMLTGRSAHFPGCPADADAEVRDTVTAAGGWIADAPSCTGTVELIERFLAVVGDGQGRNGPRSRQT
ncbi:MAG: HAD hydrolase family protein [Planctomycetes bacterium]|nr:HAD hydrolase family protein [Planctomycetota bacterium]